MDIEPFELPHRTNIWTCNFSTTYYMEIFRGARGENIKIYESPYLVFGTELRLRDLIFTDSQLCGADPDSPIEFKFIERNQYKMTDVEVGYIQTTLPIMLKGAEIPILPSGKGATTAARLHFHKIEQHSIPSFGDYLASGHEIQLMGAIDFTSSNGQPGMESSLHFSGADGNQYTQAIRSVGTILDQYDSDKKYPFFGFGGVPKFMGTQDTRNVFPLNGDDANPEIEGIDAVIEAYNTAIQDTTLSGPTCFAPVLRRAKELVESINDPKTYHILLILTDGEIHDLQETIAQVADISKRNLPMSIIIVGVGDEEFTNMVRLDGDDIAIQAGVKDIVQFVKLQEIFKRSVESEKESNLSAVLLEEIPDQMVAHYHEAGIMPGKQVKKSFQNADAAEISQEPIAEDASL